MALPLGVLAGGLVVTGALVAGSLHNNARQREATLQRRIETFAQTLGTRVQACIDTIPGLRLVASSSRRITDADFVRYVDAISLQQRFPDLALSFVAELVPDADRQAYIDEVRRDSSAHAGFDIRPPGRRPNYLVLRHQYPDDLPSMGYDLFDPAQGSRDALEAVIDAGDEVATGPLRLASDRDKPDDPSLASIVVRAATYEGGVVPDTADARRARATGVVGIGLRTAPLVRAELPNELAAEARVRVVDAEAERAHAPSLLFDSRADAGPPRPPAITQQLRVADRTWRLEFGVAPVAWWDDATLETWVVLVAGLVTTLSLAGMIRGLVRANDRAEARVHATLAQLEADKMQLSRSEGRYRMLFEHSFDAVLRTHPDGSVLAANAAACAMFGMTEAEICAGGRGRLVDPEDPRVPDLVRRRNLTGQARGRMTMRRRDGSRFEAEVSSTVYTDEEGVVTASLIIRDLSDAMREAAGRQRLEAQLRHAQKMEAVGTLASGIAHDFNNVLAVVLGNVAILAQDLGAHHPSSAQLQLVRQASLRARALVQRLLTFSRPPSENRRVQPLRPLVEEALSLLRATLPATVQMDVDLSDEPLPVLTDATQVQQIVINLCSNAWQAMPLHKGRVEVTLAGVDIDPASGVLPSDGDAPPDATDPVPRVPRRCARLRVRDDGIGMDEATRSRIFEPFFTTKRPGEGTGLGLAMVHGIVMAHGGGIVVDTRPGLGTTFDVYLPLAASGVAGSAPEAGANGAAARALFAQGQGEHVLYIDDDEVVAMTAEALLQRLGYRVTTQVDPVAALAGLAADPAAVDLVVTDFNMPGMSGLDVAAAVRALRPDLPVVITSGRVTDELVADARRTGVAHVMLKEYIAEQLGDVLASLLEGRVRARGVVVEVARAATEHVQEPAADVSSEAAPASTSASTSTSASLPTSASAPTSSG